MFHFKAHSLNKHGSRCRKVYVPFINSLIDRYARDQNNMHFPLKVTYLFITSTTVSANFERLLKQYNSGRKGEITAHDGKRAARFLEKHL